MRARLLALVTVVCGVCGACGSRGPSAPRPIDHDLDVADIRPAVAPESDDAHRPVAPPGPGLRTGTIARDRLVAVLDAGPGTFLRQLEVAPRLSGDRFVGWQLVQLIDRTGPLRDVDVVPGDVLLAINGKPLSRPEQLQLVWDSLRTANEVTAQVWRGEMKLELRFAIEPRLP
jgi:type II secretory pathway component PulC